MNPVVLYLASGESLYAGAVLLLLVLAIFHRVKNRWLVRVRNLLAAAALGMMAMACPPVPMVLLIALAAAWCAWFTLSNLSRPKLQKFTLMAAAMLALLAISIAFLEWPHRALPVLTGAPCDHLAVIGDSLSAGIETSQGKGPWPIAFLRLTGVPVKNLAQAGAQVSDGAAQARLLSGDDLIVLIELGGNDLIANVPSAEFEKHLAATLQAVDQTGSPGRIVLMFELPLLPHKMDYGRIQRRLAAQRGIYLIPKRFLTDVLSASGATSDGLHLAPAGAEEMARLVARITAPVLRK